MRWFLIHIFKHFFLFVSSVLSFKHNISLRYIEMWLKTWKVNLKVKNQYNIFNSMELYKWNVIIISSAFQCHKCKYWVQQNLRIQIAGNVNEISCVWCLLEQAWFFVVIYSMLWISHLTEWSNYFASQWISQFTL